MCASPAGRVGAQAVSGDTSTVSATATAAKQVQVSRLARGMHGRTIGVAQGQGQDGIFGGGHHALVSRL